MLNYTVLKSNRKTIAIELRPGEIIVRAPVYATKEQIDTHVRSREQWIRKHQEKLQTLPSVEPLSLEEVRALADQALQIIPPRVATMHAFLASHMAASPYATSGRGEGAAHQRGT